MKDLLIKRFDNFLKPIKQKHNIGRINTFIFDDNNYQKDAEFILFQLELFKNREELIESSNLKKEYIMDELNPVIVNNVLKKEIFELLKNFYNKILKNNIFNFGDGNYDFKTNRYNCHNEIISRIIHFEMLELVEKITGKKMSYSYNKNQRIGDHKCYIGDLKKIKNHYPRWDIDYNLKKIFEDIIYNIR